MCCQISAVQGVSYIAGDSEIMMMENFLKGLVVTSRMHGITEAEPFLEDLGMKLGY